MSALDNLPAAEMEEWRQHPVTLAYLRALADLERNETASCALEALDQPLDVLRLRAGRRQAFAEAVSLAKTKGTTDE